MKKSIPFLISLLIFGAVSLLSAQEMVEESSTGKKFPASVQFSHDGSDYSLDLTGTTVRKKFIIKVYGVAHYMADAKKMSQDAALKAVTSDGSAKQITMDFARGVGADKIQDAYRETFEKNTTKEEYAAIAPLVEQFIGYFGEDVQENEKYVLRWLPGGTVLTVVKGVEKPAITNAVFARALWSAWLGKDAIVDNKKLVERITQ